MYVYYRKKVWKNSGEMVMKIKKKIKEAIILVLPLLLALICLASVSLGNHQAMLSIPMPQELVGEYSYDGENWQELTADADISALDGDLFLRGHFLREMEEGWLLNFYCDHIGTLIKVNGEQIYVNDAFYGTDLDTKFFASVCAREWRAVLVPQISTEDTVEIYLHNPHVIGNKTAYRDFLTTLCSDPYGANLLQQNLEAYGKPFRMIGGILAIASLVLLGAAIAAVVVRIPISNMLLQLGLLMLCAGGFIAFDTIDLSFWGKLSVFNTYAQLLCMIMAVFCFEHFVSNFFVGKKHTIAKRAVLLSALFNSVLFMLSFCGVAVLYDMLPYWMVSQLFLCVFFLVCCGMELRRNPKNIPEFILTMIMFAAILFDIAGVGSSIVWRNPCSKIAFVIIFVIFIIIGAKKVVVNYIEIDIE